MHIILDEKDFVLAQIIKDKYNNLSEIGISLGDFFVGS